MSSPYPNFIKDWVQTSNGTSIEFWSSHPIDELENLQPLIFIGGIHGNEPEGVDLAVGLLDWLKIISIYNIKPWALIPCLNPGGYAKRARQNNNGVDLNRNFPSKDWSSDYSNRKYYPGPAAASEIEIKYLVNLILKIRPQIIFHFHSHTEPCVILTGTEPSTNYAESISNFSNYPLKEDIGYPTPGSLGQWGWFDQSIAVICIEEREGTKKKETLEHFLPPLKEILKK